MRKILQYLKEDQLLLGKLLGGIPYIYSYTAIQQLMYGNLNSRLINFMSIISAVLTIKLNNKWEDKDGNGITQKYFIPLMLVETVVYGALVCFYLVSRNIIIFYILNCLTNIFITLNITNCLEYLKQARYRDNRAEFQRRLSSIGSVNSIVGFTLATLKPPTVEIAFIAFYIATIADNYFQIKVFKKTFGIENLKENEA